VEDIGVISVKVFHYETEMGRRKIGNLEREKLKWDRSEGEMGGYKKRLHFRKMFYSCGATS
jgi:hypothetical protein